MKIFRGPFEASRHDNYAKAIFLQNRTREIAFGDRDDLPDRVGGWWELSRRELDQIAEYEADDATMRTDH